LSHVLQQYFREDDHFVFLVELKLFPVFRFGHVPVLYGIVEFFDDAFSEGSEVLQPSIVTFSEYKYDLKKQYIIFLFVFSHFRESLIHIGGFSCEFLPEGKGVVEGDQFEEVLEVQLSFLPVDEDRITGEFLAHCV
jgi:hypothetical protein